MKRRLLNIKRGGGLYDPDFQAWIDYNILQGHYMTSDTVKLDAANQYVIDSKADGTWQGKDVDFIFAWNDLQMADASLVCLKRLVKATVYGGCTYTLNGWEGNGVDGYINPLFKPVDYTTRNYNQDDCGQIYLSYNNEIGRVTGIAETPFAVYIHNGNNKTKFLYTNADQLNLDTDLTGIGLMSSYRISNNDLVFYNKSTKSERTGLSNHAGGLYQILISRSGTGYGKVGFSTFSFSKSFSQSENESIRTNLNTYLSAIGLTPYA